MSRLIIIFLLTLLLLIACQSSSPSENPSFVWWEAEQPAATNFPDSDHNPFAPQSATEAAILSQGAWIGIDGQYARPPFLEYTVEIKIPGTYQFYSRKFWSHGPFRWRWDNQPWAEVGTNLYLIDQVNMRDLVEATWIKVGTVDLATGRHTLRLELTQSAGAAAFDCFVLTQTPFRPRGNLKPNQSYDAPQGDAFIFDPDIDPFIASPIDLRRLNESIAGENGFIQARGEELIHQKTGEPVRFWAINTGASTLDMDAATMQYMARFLAKQGVNMVRLHGSLWSEDFRQIDPNRLKQLFRWIEALKQEGIYTALSIYFPVWLQLNPDDGFAGYNNQNPFALLFFNPQFQQIYYGWWQTLLNTINPDTGKSLKDDPAVAMVELVNEDSCFFWTFAPDKNIPAAQMELLEVQFGDWLNTKYGSLDQALARWSAANDNAPFQPLQQDRPEQGRIGFLPLYDLVAQRATQRAQDTTAFLADLQQRFFQDAIQFFRQKLDYKGLIYASNWITADSRILGPVDKYTNTVADLMDRHGYFSGIHEGSRASYALSGGDTYKDRSALLFSSTNQEQEHDFNLPIMDIRYNHLPSTITEVNWVMPNQFRSDFPLLAAAYGLLQGTDGFFFFTANKHSWESSLGKFTIANPSIMGQFPATALIYRQGLLRSGNAVVDVALKVEDILALQGAPLTAPQNIDEFRAKDIPPGQSLRSNQPASIDPLAFLVGKVNLQFTEENRTSTVTDLSPYLDRQGKTVRSATGELHWDYGKGLVTVNAPQVQGATGFLKQGGKIRLDTLALSSKMQYGTVLLVALDDQPLQQSQRMLLQVMSTDENFGWRTSDADPKTIQQVGNPPLMVQKLSGRVTLNRSDARSLRVTALDANGYPKTTIDHADRFNLLPDVFYYLIEKAA